MIDITSISFDCINYWEEHTVNSFIKSAITSILEESAEQFSILKYLNLRNHLVFDDNVEKYSSLEERFTGVENHADTRIPSRTANYDKVAQDVHNIINVFRETSREIESNDSCKVLEDYTVDVKHMSQDDKDLLCEIVNNKKKIVKLRIQFEQERMANIHTIDKTNDKIQTLRFQVESSKVYVGEKHKFFERWERARIEQNKMMCTLKERSYLSVLKSTLDKIDAEIKCHEEFTKYIDEDRQDCLEQINYWMKRYEEETESRESEMIKMRNDIENMTLMLSQMQQEKENQQKVMMEWKEYKKEQKKQKARDKEIQWASLIVQTWWRATMTRKRLGPYKSKSKKK